MKFHDCIPKWMLEGREFCFLSYFHAIGFALKHYMIRLWSSFCGHISFPVAATSPPFVDVRPGVLWLDNTWICALLRLWGTLCWTLELYLFHKTGPRCLICQPSLHFFICQTPSHSPWDWACVIFFSRLPLPRWLLWPAESWWFCSPGRHPYLQVDHSRKPCTHWCWLSMPHLDLPFSCRCSTRYCNWSHWTPYHL